MLTTEWYRQGAPRRACPYCDGHGQVTMGWPENVSWDEDASPCSHYEALRQLTRRCGGQRAEPAAVPRAPPGGAGGADARVRPRVAAQGVIGMAEECDG
jgi:hypothetical protein